MLEMIVKITGIAVTAFSTVIKVIEMVYNFKQSKSNRPSQR